MPHPIRLAILDSAIDEAILWELPWPLTQISNGEETLVHPRRTADVVMPHLLDLLRERHVEIYRDDDTPGSPLSLEVALAVASDEANWDPETAKRGYTVVATTSGEDAYRAEYEAVDGRP